MRVATLTAGCATDLRHLLDSALLQVNAEFEPEMRTATTTIGRPRTAR